MTQRLPTSALGFVCDGKERYATQAKAMKVIARKQRHAKHRHNSHHEDKRAVACLSAYRCCLCHHWHIGGRNVPKRPR